MVAREDDRPTLIARVDPARCVSCGICAGSCAPMGIGPPGRSGRDQLAATRALLELTAPGQVQSFRAWHISAGPIVFVVGLDNRIYTQPFDKFGNSAGGYQRGWTAARKWVS